MSRFNRADRIAELDKLQRLALERSPKNKDPFILARKIGGHLISIATQADSYIRRETFEKPGWKGRPEMGVILANTIGQSIYTNEAEAPYYSGDNTPTYLDRQFILPTSEGVATLRITAVQPPQANELPVDVQYRVGVYRAASLDLPKTNTSSYENQDYSPPTAENQDSNQIDPQPQELKGTRIASYWLRPWEERLPEYLLAYNHVDEESGNPDIQRKALAHAALILVGGFRHAVEVGQ